MADEKDKNWRGELRGVPPVVGISRRDYYMAHLGAAELSRHATDASLYLPDIADRAAQLTTFLMKKADENHG